jgi:hypothetical protein
LKPGEQVHVDLGGKGIDITGKLQVENAPAGFDYHFALNHLVARKPGITPPPSLAAKGFDWKQGWSESWHTSQEGKAYRNTLHFWFVKPDPDGQIRISGVEPGDYELAVHLYGSTEGCLVHPVANAVIPITVKPGQQSLELGMLTIPSMAVPNVGDVLSDVQFPLSATGSADKGDGKLALSSLRGQYVLLDFWAAWCAPCVARLGEVELLRQEYAKRATQDGAK